jgi:hypothetical protein
MTSLYFNSASSLTAARCFTFSILLLFSTIFAHTATSSRAIILPILTTFQLALEHLLETVQPNTLSTLNRYLGLLLLTIPLYAAWLFDAAVSTRCKNYETLSGTCPSQIWQWWSSTSTMPGKAGLVSEWTIVVTYLFHNTIGVMQAIEARLYQRLLKETSIDVEEKVITGELRDSGAE